LYTIQLKKKAQKYIEKQDKITQKRIKNCLMKLAEEPYDYKNKNIQKLRGYKETFKIRMADVRIKYEVIDNKLIINVLDIDNRGQVYKHP
jgi:mRNA interferase RelE/StbE